MPEKPSQDIAGAYAGTPNVQPQAGSAPQASTRATPEAFGAQVGSAVENAGKEGFDLAQHFQSIANETKARDTVLTASQKLGDLNDWYHQQQGINAQAAYPIYQQKSAEIYNEGAAAQQSPDGQKLFKDEFSKIVSFNDIHAGSHAAEETDKAYSSSLKANQGLYANMLSAQFSNPIGQQSTLKSIVDLQAQIDAHAGTPPQEHYLNVTNTKV